VIAALHAAEARASARDRLVSLCEREVVQLVAGGFTKRHIATELYISTSPNSRSSGTFRTSSPNTSCRLGGAAAALYLTASDRAQGDLARSRTTPW